MQNLGKVLQKRRQELGLSQRDLADLIGVSEMSISRYERWPDGEGGRQPRYDDLTRLAEALRVSPSYFWSGNTEIPKSMVAGMRKVSLMPLEFVACCGSGNSYAEVPMSIETVDVPENMTGHTFDDLRPIYAIKTEGDSMVCSGVTPGSIVIVNPAEPVNTGDIALVRAGDNFFVKRVKWERGGGVTLLSDGMAQSVISFSLEDLESEWVSICGKAVGVMLSL